MFCDWTVVTTKITNNNSMRLLEKHPHAGDWGKITSRFDVHHDNISQPVPEHAIIHRKSFEECLKKGVTVLRHMTTKLNKILFRR